MAVKTQITTFDINIAMVTKKVWLVDNEFDAKALEALGASAVLLTLDNGENISSWTPAKGVGNWDADDMIPLNFLKVYVAFTPAVRLAKNTDKLITELKAQMAARGAGVEVLTVPNGQTVADLARKHSDPTYLVDALKATDDVADDHHDGDDTPEADVLFSIAEDRFNFHFAEEDGGFLTRKEGPQYAYIVSGGTPSLRNYLINEYRLKTKKVPAKGSVTDAINALEAACEQSVSRTRKLHIRTAKSKSTGNVWVDLGRIDGQFIGITGDKWGVATRPDVDVFFKRTDEIKELPIPHMVAPCDVQDTLTKLLRPAFNVADEEFPLIVAWMVAQVMPDYRAPVAMFLGESGSGKTSATSTLSSILEGVAANGSLMPDGKDNLAVTISQEKISIWNNVSKISAQSSDDICQYIDGASYKKRKLHSNDGVVNLTLNPSILLNGISFDGDLRADLKTRSLIFNMATMNAASSSIDQIVGAAMDAHPVILGAVYTLCAQVMAAMPVTVIPMGASRMVDYTKSLLILDGLWGLDGAGYNRYMAATAEMSVDAIEDPVFQTIYNLTVNGAYIQADGTYRRTFTSDELYIALNNYSQGGRVARQLLDLALTDTRSITAYLKRNVTDWKKFGFSYTDHGSSMVDGVRASRKSFSFDPSESHGLWMTHTEAQALQKF